MPREPDSGTGTVVREKTHQKPKKPPLYRVLMHNDDYTTRDFVVYVLETVFHHDEASAVRIMLHVHHNGVGVAGVFTREVAETKIHIVEQLAAREEFPLLLTMEPTEDEE